MPRDIKERVRGLGNEAGVSAHGQAPTKPEGPQEGRAPTTYSAADLLNKTFDPIRWAVPGILAEGVTLFAGKAKQGKTWWAMGAAVAVATGGVALGKKPVEKGTALYLALEDNERRLQTRLRKMVSEGADLSSLYYKTEWSPLGRGGAEDLDAWLREHPDARLVVVDILKNIRPSSGGNRNVYDMDYEALAPLRPLAAEHNVAILVIHHLNKWVDPDDPFDAISGSTGLTGGVDNVLILNRERGKPDAFLYVDGRDIEEQGEFAVKWDQEACTWTLQEGTAAEYRLSEFRKAIRQIVEDAGEPVTPTHVTDALKEAGHDKSFENVKTTMWRMSRDGQLDSNGKGKYSLPTGNPVNPSNPSNPVNPSNPGHDPVTGVTDDSEGSNPTFPHSYAENGASVNGVTRVTGEGGDPYDRLVAERMADLEIDDYE